MDNYNIEYDIVYCNKYEKNIIDIKFLYNENIIFNFKSFYSRFYSIFVQNYNFNYRYYQLSQNCDFEIEYVNNIRILNIILTNYIDDECKRTTKTTFSVIINNTFHHFLDELKSNHYNVVKNSKW
jgi:hypothetical protein